MTILVPSILVRLEQFRNGLRFVKGGVKQRCSSFHVEGFTCRPHVPTVAWQSTFDLREPLRAEESCPNVRSDYERSRRHQP